MENFFLFFCLRGMSVLVLLLVSTSWAQRECGISRYNRHRQPRPYPLNTDKYDDSGGHPIFQDLLEVTPNESNSDLEEQGFHGYSSPGYPSRGYSSRLEQNSTLRTRTNNRMMIFDDISTGRIVGGKESTPGAWPWQVSLQLIHPRWGRIGHWCGGVLIDDRWVVTAAHCINNQAFNYPWGPLWTAVVGEWDRAANDETEVQLRVEKIILHERFKEYNNDIALLRLSPISNEASPSLMPICLPDSVELRTFTFEGFKCFATGWGKSLTSGNLHVRLQESRVPVQPPDTCLKAYNIPDYGYVKITDAHICAGVLDGSTGTCVGDSGGPLQCNMRDGRWYLAGITSFGSGCAKPGFPDVYTRITYYLPWIKHQMRIHR